jgi:hypothetical protein
LDGKVAIATGTQRRIWAGIVRGLGAAGPQMARQQTRTPDSMNGSSLSRGTDEMFLSMNDDELRREVARGRNCVFYMLCHLTAVHDRLLPLLGFGERLHPELDDDFVINADAGFHGGQIRLALTKG